MWIQCADNTLINTDKLSVIKTDGFRDEYSILGYDDLKNIPTVKLIVTDSCNTRDMIYRWITYAMNENKNYFSIPDRLKSIEEVNYDEA